MLHRPTGFSVGRPRVAFVGGAEGNGGEWTGGVTGLIAVGSPGDLGPLSFGNLEQRYYIVMLGFLYPVIIGTWLMSRTAYVRRLMAIRDNTVLAESLGINVFYYRLTVFVVSGTVAGLAGPLFLYHIRVVEPPQFGTFSLVNLLLMVVMGGLEVLPGPAIGAWIVTFLPHWLGPAGLDDPGSQQIAFGTLLILFMLIAPRGIGGSALDWSRRVQSRRRSTGAAPAPPPPDERIAARPPMPRPPLTRRAPPHVGSEPLLVVEGLSKRFGAVDAVRDVGVTISRGEIVGIIGPNGSGKTTLFQCISGFYKASAGKVIWRAADITGWSPHRISRRGLVKTFQHSMLFRSFTVRGNLQVAQEALDSLGRRQIADVRLPASVPEMLQFYGLDGVADQVALNLPQGTSRKLGIAMALATKPELLLLDEPAAGLNGEESRELAEVLLRVSEAGVTLAIVDHDMQFLMPLCDRVVVLDAGRKLVEGLPAAVQRDRRVISAYLGEQFAGIAFADTAVTADAP